MPRVFSDADFADEQPAGRVFSEEDFADSAPAEVSKGESAYRGAVQGASVTFGDEVAAGFGAAAYGVAKGVRAVLPGGVPEDAPGVVDVYRTLREQFRTENAQAEAANPGTYTTFEIAGGLASSGVNPYSAGKAAAVSGYALLRGGARPAARALLSSIPEAARGAVKGAGYGAAYGLGSSEADLTQGEFAQAGADVAEGAETGAKFGAGAGLLLGAGSRALAGRTARAGEEAATVAAVGKFDEATAALPEQRAAVAAENAAAKEADTAAAKAEAKSATKAKQKSAQAAQREETLKNPLIRTGLEGKQRTLGGGPRAKARAEALVNEPVPGDPTKRLVDEADKLSVDQRLTMANALRRETGAQLGTIRDELAKAPDVAASAGSLRDQVRGAFAADLPTEVQARALEQIDALIGAVAKDGKVTPAALRKLIEDAEGFAKFGTPNLEAALGQARPRVFQNFRAVLTGTERELIAQALPDRAPEYAEALRKYGVFSDFEMGSKVFFEKFYKGKPTISVPKVEKVEPVAPRALREGLLKPEPAAPEFPGGEEALAAGRKLLEPSAGTRAVAEGLRSYGATAAGAAGYAVGGYFAGAAATLAGAKLAKPAAALWTRMMTPTATSLPKTFEKLERLKPLMEEAVRQGPAAVAALHANFMAKSPDYRKAVESRE